MPIQIREEDSRLYVKVLIGFSIVQVLLAMILFVYLNASPAALGRPGRRGRPGDIPDPQVLGRKETGTSGYAGGRVRGRSAAPAPLHRHADHVAGGSEGRAASSGVGYPPFHPVRHYPYLSGVYAAADGGFRHPRPPFRRGEPAGLFHRRAAPRPFHLLLLL